MLDRFYSDASNTLLQTPFSVDTFVCALVPFLVQSWLPWTPTLPWFPPARPDRLLLRRLLHLLLRKLSASRSRSGTPSLYGPGILLWIIVQFVGIILWISVLSAKLIKLVLLARNAQLLGEFATMHFTSTALVDGLRLVKCVH